MSGVDVAKAKRFLESRGYKVSYSKDIKESKELQKHILDISDGLDRWSDIKSHQEEDDIDDLSMIDQLIKDAGMNPDTAYATDEEALYDFSDLRDAINELQSNATEKEFNRSEEFKEKTGDPSAFASATLYTADDGSQILAIWVGGGYESVPALYIIDESIKVNEGVGDIDIEPDGHTYYLLALDRNTNLPGTKYYENISEKAKEILSQAGIPESDIEEITQMGYDDITYVVKDKDKSQVNRIAHRLAAVAEPYSEENAMEYDMRPGDTVAISGPYLENKEFDVTNDVEFWNM